MATFNAYSLELLKQKGLVVYLEYSPEVICQRLFEASNDLYIVKTSRNKLICPNCNCMMREAAKHCWRCTRFLMRDQKVKVLTVKLVSNGVPLHGLISAALASWNPCVLKFLIRQHRKGTELKVEFAGALSIREFLLFTSICCASSVALYKGSEINNDCFHSIVAILILAIGPPAYFALRKSQEQTLLDFLHSLPQWTAQGAQAL